MPHDTTLAVLGHSARTACAIRVCRLGLDGLLPYGLILPALLVAVAVAVVPLVYDMWLSLQDWYLLRSPTPTWGGLVNFRQAFGNAALWAAFWRTWVWTLGTVMVELALGLPIALLLNRDTAVSRLASALILAPWVTPFVVLGFSWRFLLDSDVGQVQHALVALGLAGHTSILNDPSPALAVLTFISGWKGMPFMVIAVLAALKAIPDELYEAAEIDGAGRWAQLAYVTLPSIRGTVVVISLVLGILAFYSFDLPWIMTRGGPQDATTIVGLLIYKAVFLDLRPAYAAAVSVMMLTVLFVTASASLRLRRAAAP